MGGMNQNPYLYQNMYDQLLNQQQPVEQEPWYARGQLGGLGRALGQMSQAALDPRVNAGSALASGLNDWSAERKEDFQRKQYEGERERAMNRQELFDKIGLINKDRNRVLQEEERAASEERAEAYREATSRGMESLQSIADTIRHSVDNNERLSPEEKAGWQQRIDTLSVAAPGEGVEVRRKELLKLETQLEAINRPDEVDDPRIFTFEGGFRGIDKKTGKTRYEGSLPKKGIRQPTVAEGLREKNAIDARIKAKTEEAMLSYKGTEDGWVEAYIETKERMKLEVEAEIAKMSAAKQRSSVVKNEAGLGEDLSTPSRDLTKSQRDKAISIIRASGEVSSSEWNSMPPDERIRLMREALGA